MSSTTEPAPREWFEQWHEPGEFYRTARKGLAAHCKELVSNEGSKFSPPQYLCDALYAGWFARIWRDDRGPCKVRLVSRCEERPDAQLKPESGDDLDIEITMALKEGYRPYKEIEEVYRAKYPKPITTTDEELQQSARKAIAKAIRKKVGKSYLGHVTLLIITDASLSPEEMKLLTEPGKSRFRNIYLLCGMDAVMTWPALRVLRGKEPF